MSGCIEKKDGVLVLSASDNEKVQRMLGHLRKWNDREDYDDAHKEIPDKWLWLNPGSDGVQEGIEWVMSMMSPA